MELPLIRFNLKDRGRKYTGKHRNFDVRAIAEAINSPKCQEMVAVRDMVGYYGHAPRIRFGMRPPEGVIDGGKYAPVEPAFVTTYLKADNEGNIEHRAEIFDNASGRAVAGLWNARVGGFSSAIDGNRPEFFGFDYVLNPNFLENSTRGIVLDDALSGDLHELTYDDIFEAEREERAEGMIILLDSIKKERELFNGTVERLQAENEQLLSMLASRGLEASVVLDSAGVTPLVVSKSAMDRMKRDRAVFFSAKLPRVVVPADNETPAYDPMAERMINRASR